MFRRTPNTAAAPASPAQAYRRALECGAIDPDPAQQQAVAALQTLQAQLLSPSRRGKPARGLYLWGPVGRGKTYLMDLFCQSLPQQWVWRTHFHRFMAWVHRRLQTHAGHKNPLAKVARDVAGRCRVLCFDELFVSDIGDAMLLGNLFDSLFQQRLVLVATSNLPPAQLYRDGLQRERFLPAIDLLQRHTRSLHLDGERDHRQRPLCASPTYFSQLPAGLLDTLQLPARPQPQPLSVQGRRIETLGRGPRSLWCSFSQLCETQRSHLDYIELASRFTTVLLSDVPQLSSHGQEQIKARGTEEAVLTATATGARQIVLGQKDDAVRRFISLVDEFYERRVNLYLVSPIPLDQLYTQGSLLFEFQRTRSRLIEMGSREYLQLAHQP